MKYKKEKIFSLFPWYLLFVLAIGVLVVIFMTLILPKENEIVIRRTTDSEFGKETYMVEKGCYETLLDDGNVANGSRVNYDELNCYLRYMPDENSARSTIEAIYKYSLTGKPKTVLEKLEKRPYVLCNGDWISSYRDGFFITRSYLNTDEIFYYEYNCLDSVLNDEKTGYVLSKMLNLLEKQHDEDFPIHDLATLVLLTKVNCILDYDSNEHKMMFADKSGSSTIRFVSYTEDGEEILYGPFDYDGNAKKIPVFSKEGHCFWTDKNKVYTIDTNNDDAQAEVLFEADSDIVTLNFRKSDDIDIFFATGTEIYIMDDIEGERSVKTVSFEGAKELYVNRSDKKMPLIIYDGEDFKSYKGA